MEPNKTRNNITVGDRVMYTGPSRLNILHGQFADSLLKRGHTYTVEFVFMGDDFEQLELKEESEHLFIHDMFIKR